MSPDIHQLIIVFTAYIIAAGSPGPSNMRIMGVAMHDGRRAALILALGVVSGSIFWGLMAATGISAVLSQYPQALLVLQVLGGFYLLYLSFRAGRAALISTENHRRLLNEQRATAATLYKRGLLMHLTNPKSILAWIALMTLGLGPGSSSHTVVPILVGCAVLSVTIFCGYAIVFSTAYMIDLYSRIRRGIEFTLALFFAFAGLKLLFTVI